MATQLFTGGAILLANRALDMPDGEHLFGRLDGGEPVLRTDGVGLMLDGKALASGVVGLNHAVRTFQAATGAPLFEVVRMASLTPAPIAGRDDARLDRTGETRGSGGAGP